MSAPGSATIHIELKKLYLGQKKTLDIFLANGAITQAQYKKTLGDLKKKMGMESEA